MASTSLTRASLARPAAATSRPHARAPAPVVVGPRRWAAPPRLAARDVAAAAAVPSANEQRWAAQISEGRVKSVTAKGAGELMKDGWTLLDVRPPYEVAKASVRGAVAIPLYVPEGFDSPAALLKHATWAGMGGLWLGGLHVKPNPSFLADVLAAVPNDGRGVVVACQKGLRSLAAAEQLARAGYDRLAWVNGGLDTAGKGDLEVVGATDLRYGGIGGLSSALGWTDVQREDGRGDALGGPNRVILAAAAVVVADVVWFATTTGPALLEQMRAGGGGGGGP